MKQTIAELGINNFGWIIIYNNGLEPKQIVYVQVVAPCTEEPETLMPRYFVLDTTMSRTLTVFANEVVYSTYEEAEEELKKEVKDDSHSTYTEKVKKDTDTFIKNIKNIAGHQPYNIDWKQVRINAAISALNALLETTKHSVTEEPIINKIYARIAVGYADALIKELKKN